MSSASKELAVTRVTEAYTAPLAGQGRWNNNGIWIWVILFVIFFVFNGGGNLGIGSGCGCGGGGRHRHHHHHHHHHHGDNNNNIFGENGWFILIIFAALFLFNDSFGGPNTNIINVDTDDTEV